MSMIEVKMQSNAKKVLDDLEEKLKQAATMVGGTIEGHAKELCPVDTGLLRNSITYALGGEAPAISQYASDDGSETGQYSGVAPRDKKGQVTVYLGTNVHYATYQELGAPSINLKPKPFIRPAMENFTNEIEQIIKKTLK